MSDADTGRRPGGALAQQASFHLERFFWDAPDRLGVSGTFAGLGEAPSGEPVLVARAGDRELRLPAVADTMSGPPEDGPWQAQFAWQEAPVAFEAITLALGDELAVELPEPAASRPRFRRRMLEVRRIQRAPSASPRAGGVERLRLEAELLAATEQAREMTVVSERANDELARVRADLQAERERSAADARRFREALAQVGGSVEEEIAAERSAAAEVRTDLERVSAEVVVLRAELDRTRGETTAALDALSAARTATDESRADAERLLGRLTAIVDGLAPPQ
jgi:hypothetical protein